MNGKLSKLIHKYCKETKQPDSRAICAGQVFNFRPDEIIKQKIKKMGKVEKLRFIKEMKKEIN